MVEQQLPVLAGKASWHPHAPSTGAYQGQRPEQVQMVSRLLSAHPLDAARMSIAPDLVRYKAHDAKLKKLHTLDLAGYPLEQAG